MAYTKSDFKGDSEYHINCTGDCVRGDEVRFQKAVFSGNYPKVKFEGFETITGKIISDSYGEKKQQHTFTILTTDGNKISIKGRNLYKESTFRKKWTDEYQRRFALNEKHKRGEAARAQAQVRKTAKPEDFGYVWAN